MKRGTDSISSIGSNLSALPSHNSVILAESIITEIGVVKTSDGSILLRMWDVDVPAGERALRRHSHLCFEISYVRSGGGIYTVGDRTYNMKEGDVFIFSCNEQHCITSSENSGLRITNLHFEPRLLWGSSPDRLSDENINLCFTHNINFESRIPADNSIPLLSILHAIREELLLMKSEYALSVKSYLNFLLIRLVRDYGYTGSETFLQNNILHSIRRVMTYIDLNPSEVMSLESLADMASMSPNYFSSVFHRTSGITLWNYINIRRINKAIILMSESPLLNMIDIATACGFNNTANFNKAFKKVIGMTPREYKASDIMYHEII